MTDHLDDDENIKAMRETAQQVGLTGLLVKACASDDHTAVKQLLRKALRLLGRRT